MFKLLKATNYYNSIETSLTLTGKDRKIFQQQKLISILLIDIVVIIHTY